MLFISFYMILLIILNNLTFIIVIAYIVNKYASDYSLYMSDTYRLLNGDYSLRGKLLQQVIASTW